MRDLTVHELQSIQGGSLMVYTGVGALIGGILLAVNEFYYYGKKNDLTDIFTAIVLAPAGFLTGAGIGAALGALTYNITTKIKAA